MPLDFSRLDAALKENSRLLGGLSRWAQVPPHISPREQALLGREVLTGETVLPRTAGPGGDKVPPGTLGEHAPRPASEE